MTQPEQAAGKTGARGEKLRATLTRKIGPVPIWVIGLFAFALAAFYFWRKQSSGSTSTTSGTDLNASGNTLADLYANAGPMPYYGGDTYVNVTVPTEIDQHKPHPPVATPGGGGGTHPPIGGGGGGYGNPHPGPPAPPPRQQTYSVRSGDSLNSIASQYHTTWQKLFQANQATITNAAKAHGVKTSFWNYIYPSEKLSIPG